MYSFISFSGTDDQTQLVLDSGVLQYMPQLLSHYKEKINKVSCGFKFQFSRVFALYLDHWLANNIMERLDVRCIFYIFCKTK